MASGFRLATPDSFPVTGWTTGLSVWVENDKVTNNPDRMRHINAATRNLAIACAIVTLTGAASVHVLTAAEAKPKYTTKEVMKTLHKGQDNIAKHVSQGAGTKEEIEKLVEYYASLPLNEPPKGDKASWSAKSTALLKAAQDLKAGKPNALAGYKQAVNCKACHSAHKPD